MDAVSESHTNFGARFPRQKLMPYLRFLVATDDASPVADLVSQKLKVCWYLVPAAATGDWFLPIQWPMLMIQM